MRILVKVTKPIGLLFQTQSRTKCPTQDETLLKFFCGVVLSYGASSQLQGVRHTDSAKKKKTNNSHVVMFPTFRTRSRRRLPRRRKKPQAWARGHQRSRRK